MFTRLKRWNRFGFARQDVLAIIGALILNAAPNPNQSVRSRRGTRGMRLWGTLLSVISEHEGTTIEQTSIRWPVALRRRFLCGLYYRTRKRWPYTPYPEVTQLDMPVERSEFRRCFRTSSPERKAAFKIQRFTAPGYQEPGGIVYGL